ncbi:MAG: acetyl-CoA carboxylase biotin carboxyl carrier protein [FCB group bacterium]|nr:acetyl-CoA carboxylase biotin carboxyl carrier protein [FCB group bacterium]MBL7028059.1 acetyl-CoA carboxylase biotin carboxyl carrier protein [Candidatus Neomarinimicrobiota bacterium]MBL7122797.1 acetyl-CoA carboxylase biotin carboxyl carrier protein [Candidatus Neomarinimicrobiota bacterium]
MNTKDIEQLIELLEKSTISEIEVGKWGRMIRVSRQGGNVVVQNSAGVPAPTQTPAPAQASTETEDDESSLQGLAIKSPMVGTFYRSPSPDVDAFVKVGDHVKKGDTLCIIEAMKIMNEVEAEVSGVILDVQIENAQPVEYGQTLFLIEP